MAVATHPCGCTFDADFVDEVHHEEGQPHSLKGQRAEAKEEKSSLVKKVAAKVLHSGKKPKDEADDEEK